MSSRLNPIIGAALISLVPTTVLAQRSSEAPANGQASPPPAAPEHLSAAQETAVERSAVAADDPAAGVINVAVLNVTNYLIGPNDRVSDLAVVQAVLPIPVLPTLNVNMLTRVPIAGVPSATNPAETNWGMGDISLGAFVTPTIRSNFKIGLGPFLRFPTGTNPRIGFFDSAALSIGPSIAVVATPGRFILGAIVSNVWSVAFTRSNAVQINELLIQPAVSLRLPFAWYLTSAPIISADWTQSAGQQWLVPVGGGVGRITMLNRTAGVRVEVQAFWNAVRPDPGPVWSLYFRVALFWPDTAGN